MDIFDIAIAKTIAGGGSSDFSTAQVTFNNTNKSSSYMVIIAQITETLASTESISAMTIEVLEDPVTVTVPLYKGSNIIPAQMMNNLDYHIPPSATGDVVMDFENSCLIINGDGTFTAAAAKVG